MVNSNEKSRKIIIRNNQQFYIVHAFYRLMIKTAISKIFENNLKIEMYILKKWEHMRKYF